MYLVNIVVKRFSKLKFTAIENKVLLINFRSIVFQFSIYIFIFQINCSLRDNYFVLLSVYFKAQNNLILEYKTETLDFNLKFQFYVIHIRKIMYFQDTINLINISFGLCYGGEGALLWKYRPFKTN